MRLPRRRLISLGAFGLILAACTPSAPPIVPTSAPTAPEPTTTPQSPVLSPQSSPSLDPTPQSSVLSPQSSPSPSPSPAPKQGLVKAALGNLSKTLHPYPHSASYTQPW